MKLSDVAQYILPLFGLYYIVTNHGPFQTKMPTYDELKRDSFNMTTKQKVLVYESDGWSVAKVYPTGDVHKIKLISCKFGKCMYYRRNADHKDRDAVFAYEVSCSSQKFRSKYATEGGKWGTWYPLHLNLDTDETSAYRKYCN